MRVLIINKSAKNIKEDGSSGKNPILLYISFVYVRFLLYSQSSHNDYQSSHNDYQSSHNDYLHQYICLVGIDIDYLCVTLVGM